ncbi:MAG: hypothetical protein J0M04_21915 [Verrucomicrobia bacterium]|nr:hypothetical protein [Verrucomicrobiota bacterium]
MKTSIIPVTCATALALMAAAVGSHWWSVRGFVAAVNINPLIASADTIPEQSAPAASVAPVISEPTRRNTPLPAAEVRSNAPDSPQKQFYANLLAELQNIRQENSTLRNQLAETNRDLVNLQFQVDSHSSQFRPLRVQDETPDYEEPEILTDPPILDNSPGVLPPRPDIAGLPDLQGPE